MTGAVIAELLIRLGPIAFDLIEDLVAVWSKEMTPAEVKAFVAEHRKSYDDYIAAERESRQSGSVT